MSEPAEVCVMQWPVYCASADDVHILFPLMKRQWLEMVRAEHYEPVDAGDPCIIEWVDSQSWQEGYLPLTVTVRGKVQPLGESIRGREST